MNSSLLFVMYKPDGYSRVCTRDEVSSVLSGWNSVLHWLGGADHDGLTEPRHVAYVSYKASQQTPHFPDYDINVWRECAIGLPSVSRQATDLPLPELGYHLYVNLGLERLSASHCWLNRVPIEMLYGREPLFNKHRQLLVPRLLDGPVQMERWAGKRISLAHATKFLIRHVLSSENVTNLLHVSRLTNADAAMVETACDVDDLDITG